MTIEEAYDRGYEAGVMKSAIDAELISDQREVEKAEILRKLNKPISASFRKWAEDYIAKNPTPEPPRTYTEAEMKVAYEAGATSVVKWNSYSDFSQIITKLNPPKPC